MENIGLKDVELKKLCEKYIFDVLKASPEGATYMGIHDYDEEVSEITPETTEKHRKMESEFLNEIEKIGSDELSFDTRVTRDAIVSKSKADNHLRDNFDLEYSCPAGTNRISGGLFALFTKEFAPFEERISKIAARLEKYPQFLHACRSMMKDPVKLWVEMEIDHCKGPASLINTICDAAKDNLSDEKLLSRLNNAAEKVIEAVEEYKGWLATDVLPRSKDKHWMEPEVFSNYLHLRKLGMTAEEMISYAAQVKEFALEERKKLAEMIAPGKSVEEAQKVVASKHPKTFEEGLEYGKRKVAEAREFIKTKDFATLPDDEILEVIETPEYCRTILPSGGYNPPGFFDKTKKGHYFFTKPFFEKGQTMEMHNYGSIISTAIHEGYPGHHLQFACEKTAGILERKLTEAVEFIEGWAHYGEEKVINLGFSPEPETLFEHCNDMLWRAARIIIDIKLSSGLMTFEEAIEYLQKEAGFDPHRSRAEVLRYTYTPGYQLSYLIGKKMMLDLEAEIKEKLGVRFDMKKFHDTILYSGALPMHYMRKVVLEKLA